MAFTLYRDTDVTMTFEVRNTAGSLIDLTGYSAINLVIGTTADAFVAVKTGVGLDGTGDYNATVTLTNDDTVWDALTGSSYKYQLNLTDSTSKITIPLEDTLTVKNQIPQA